jgi:hypothetical protein
MDVRRRRLIQGLNHLRLKFFFSLQGVSCNAMSKSIAPFFKTKRNAV